MSEAIPVTLPAAESLLARSYQQWLARVAPDLPASLRSAIELLLQAVEAGHVCIRLAPEFTADWDDLITAGNDWVGKPGSYTPFVLDDSERFYLARYWHHEERVAALLRARAMKMVMPLDAEKLKTDLDGLFEHDPEDRQRLAALLAQFKPLTLVSGGPGTGKTTTVVKMLALLQMQSLNGPQENNNNCHPREGGDPATLNAEALGPRLRGGGKNIGPLRILLAAPTGKAAQRLTESIRTAKETLPLSAEQKALIPEDAQTLHRLLGAQGDTGRFRHDQKNPLACDLLLIDEASMIDLALMHAVLDALPADARLVLLGDRDQLASVEAGSVFGDLCSSQGCSQELRTALQSYDVALSPHAPATALADCRVELTHSYRFAAGSGIAQLASAAREGNVDAFMGTLETHPADLLATDVQWHAASDADALRQALNSGYADFRRAALSGDAAQAFAAFLGFRVLCAHRKGWRGVEGLNALMEAARVETWYAGRPVIVRENNYALRLFNGDIGICLPTPDGLRVFFESGTADSSAAQGKNAGYRALAPGRLPAHEAAWAMTVHQAQGSEFDAVMLVLPEVMTAVLDRPLIYTAVTRARKQFSLHGAASVIAESLARLPQRESGLVEKLL
ncbi:MAG: exodeoxyribonuclease V subunit alpha [bacterium]|nr:exodeoxyribonuclease V subunit alpha [bacterium]